MREVVARREMVIHRQGNESPGARVKNQNDNANASESDEDEDASGTKEENVGNAEEREGCGE
jgi:hypothetical protein